MTAPRRTPSVCLGAIAVLLGLPPHAARGQSSPAAPFSAVPVSEAPTKALQVVGDHLFVAAWGWGIQVLDISEPTHPRWVGGWNPRKCPMGIHVVRGYAYVANRRAGLSVLDVRSPANPILVGSASLPGDAMAINVAGRYAFVAVHPTGFHIVDVRDSSRPVLLGTASTPQPPASIHAVGHFAGLAEPDGLQVFDVSDPARPLLIASRRFLGPAFRIQLVGHRAYVATGQSGLLIYDLTVPGSLLPVDSLLSQTNNLPIMVRQPEGFSQIGYTWMLTNAGVRAHLEKRLSPNKLPDMEDIVEAVRNSPAYPDLLNRQTLIPPRLHGLHVMPQYALGLGTGLEVISLCDSTNPRRVGGCDLEGPTWDVRGAGRYAYVMDNGANIHVFDVGNVARPVKVARFDARGFASRVLPVRDAGTPVVLPPEETYADVPVVTGPPELVDPKRLPDGSFAFTLVGLGGATYLVQASSNLRHWVPLSTNVLPASGRLQITDPAATAQSDRFYRAVRQ